MRLQGEMRERIQVGGREGGGGEGGIILDKVC